MAFLQAIELEGDVPARYIALAKAEEKLGNTKKAIEALENAYELDRNVATLRQILALYESMEDAENIITTSARIEEQIAEDNAKKKPAPLLRRAGRVAKKSAAAKPAANKTKKVI